MSDVDDQQVEIDADACLALTGDAEQCGNGTDTDASDPEAGLCGVHAGSDAVRVADFDNPAWVSLRDDLVDLLRSETEAYALATISPNVEDVWHALTGLQDLTVGPVELTASQACGRARDLADHPDLDVDDHPLVVGGCIALQGKSAKNHSCPNSGYGTTLLCGMHKDADLRGTVLDDDEPGPDLDTVTVDGAEYQLVERRGVDLIVVDPREYELLRLDEAAPSLPPDEKMRLFATTGTGGEGDDDPECEPLVRPQPAGSLPKYLVEGVEKQSPDRLRRLAEYAEQMADYKEEKAQRDLEERAEQDVDETPDDWDEDEWREAVDEARDQADLPPTKGTLTMKNIDGRDYYYLQWRAGGKIKSQYVAPVNPAGSD